MEKNSAFKLRSGNKPSATKFFKGVKNTGLAKNMGSKQFQQTGQKKNFKDTRLGQSLSRTGKDLKKTQVGKLVTGLTGSIFGSKKNPQYKGKGRSLLGTLAHSRRKFKAKTQNKPTVSDGFGTAIGGQKGVTITAQGPTTKIPRGGAKYSDAINIDKSKSFFS